MSRADIFARVLQPPPSSPPSLEISSGVADSHDHGKPGPPAASSLVVGTPCEHRPGRQVLPLESLSRASSRVDRRSPASSSPLPGALSVVADASTSGPVRAPSSTPRNHVFVPHLSSNVNSTRRSQHPRHSVISLVVHGADGQPGPRSRDVTSTGPYFFSLLRTRGSPPFFVRRGASELVPTFRGSHARARSPRDALERRPRNPLDPGAAAWIARRNTERVPRRRK